MRTLAIAGCVLLVAGCVKDTIKAAPPKAAQVVEVQVPTYVIIPAELRKRCDWPKAAPLSNVIEVAHARRVCIEQYERQFDAIDVIQGKAAP